jgi:hypothetical protein
MNYSERHSRIVNHWFIIPVLGYTIPHTSATTAEVIEDFGDLKYFNTLLTDLISDFTPSDFWLFAALKKHKRNSFHM